MRPPSVSTACSQPRCFGNYTSRGVCKLHESLESRDPQQHKVPNRRAWAAALTYRLVTELVRQLRVSFSGASLPPRDPHVPKTQCMAPCAVLALRMRIVSRESRYVRTRTRQSMSPLVQPHLTPWVWGAQAQRAGSCWPAGLTRMRRLVASIDAAAALHQGPVSFRKPPLFNPKPGSHSRNFILPQPAPRHTSLGQHCRM